MQNEITSQNVHFLWFMCLSDPDKNILFSEIQICEP